MPCSASIASSTSAWATVRGKAVEQAAFGAVGLGEPLGDDAHDDLVGNELAEMKIAGRLIAELGAGLMGLTQHVAGREMRDAEIVLEPLGLRPFSSTRRAEKHDAHDMRVGGRAAKSQGPETPWRSTLAL